jgi:flavin-binding protein dodecin
LSALATAYVGERKRLPDGGRYLGQVAELNGEWTWLTIGLKLCFGDKPRSPHCDQRRFAMPDTTEMKDHVYKILELVGSSEKSIEDAIQNAITRASKTIRYMKWFEVTQTRGHIENGSVRHYQVTLRVGFTLEG